MADDNSPSHVLMLKSYMVVVYMQVKRDVST